MYKLLKANLYRRFINQKAYWFIKSKIYRIKNYLIRKNVNLNFLYEEQKTNLYVFYYFLKKSLFYFFWTTLIIILSEKIECSQIFHLLVHIEPSITLANDIYYDLAILIATVSSIFFAALNIVASTTYASLSGNVRRLIWQETWNKFYFKLSIFLLFFLITLAGINWVGYGTGYINFIITLLLTLVWIVGFSVVAIRMFEFFSPASLIISSVIPSIKYQIKTVSIGGNSCQDAMAQQCQANKTIRDIQLLKNLAEIYLDKVNQNKDNKALDSSDIKVIISNLFELLYVYSLRKTKIPINSKWFLLKNKHTSWFDTASGKVDIAAHVGSKIEPQRVPDMFWVENEILSIIISFFELISEAKKEELFIYTLNVESDYLYRLAGEGHVDISFLILKTLSLNTKEMLLNSYSFTASEYESVSLSSLKKMLILAECYSNCTLGLLSGLLEFLKNIFPSYLDKIDNISWSSEQSVYKNNFPSGILARLVDTQKKIKLEVLVEGIKVTPDWYIKQRIAAGFIELIELIIDEVCIFLNTEVLCLFEKTAREHPLLAVALLSNSLMFITKIEILADEIIKVNNQISTLLKVKDIPCGEVSIDKLIAGCRSFKNDLLEHICSQIKTIPTFPKDFDIPDYLGQWYWIIGDECLSSIINNKTEVFKKLYNSFMFLVFEIYQQECAMTKTSDIQSQALKTTDIFFDLLAISGAAIVYGELEHNDVMKFVKQKWDALISSGQDFHIETFLIKILNAVSVRHSFSSTNRENHRFKWRAVVTNDLISKDIFQDINPLEYKHAERQEGNSLLSILAEHREMGLISELAYVFIAVYLHEKLSLSSEPDYPYQLKVLINALSKN